MARADDLGPTGADPDTIDLVVSSPPIFSRDQAERVLRRAAQLQAGGSSQALALSDDTMTLDTLEEAAAEVGIDRHLVRRAAGELEHTEAVGTWLGFPTHARIHRWLDRELGHEELKQAIAMLNRGFGTVGQTHLDDGSLTWFSHWVQVSIITGDGQTSICVQEPFVRTLPRESLLVNFLSVMGGSAMFGFIAEAWGTALAVLIGLPLFVLLVTAAFFSHRWLHRQRLNRLHRRFAAIADTVVARFQNSEKTNRALPKGESDRT